MKNAILPQNIKTIMDARESAPSALYPVASVADHLQAPLKGRQSVGGFTLIEVLVCIAIIGVLAALIFPMVDRGIFNAHKAGCIANIRQLGTATIQYAGDNNGSLPHRPLDLQETPDSKVSYPWHGSFTRQALGGYLDPASKVYFCPSNQKSEYTPSAGSPFWGYSARFTGEKLIVYLQEAPLQGYAGKDVPIIWDVSYHDWGDERIVYCSHQTRKGRHPAPGQNAIFGDGHVEWIASSDNRFMGSR
jgi:prepilin-type N-terminal cleavage/methylation domain-containing protein